jgi:hypothetical protein
MAQPSAPAAPGIASKPIMPAPQVRTRPARPAKRPEIKLSERPVESRWVGPLPLAIGLIALAVILGFAHRIISRTEDPHYVQAVGDLRQYETGRTAIELNYDAPVYANALSDLAKVDPGSISVEKAAALADDIKAKTELFHRRIAAQAEEQQAIQQANIDREKEYLDAYQRDLLSIKKDYPECNEGNKAHAR